MTLPTSPARTHRQGWTLPEVLVTLTLVGILSALAYPSYAHHLARGHRVEAQRALLEAAHHLLRLHAMQHRLDDSLGGEAISLPATLRQTPAHGDAVYRLHVARISAHTFNIEAVPEVSGPMRNDPCGTLAVDELLRLRHTGAAAASLCAR